MDDELDPFDRRQPDLDEAGCEVGTDQHDEVVVGEIDRSDRVAVSMEDVLVSDPVAASALDDHGIHAHQVSLTAPVRQHHWHLTRIC